MKMLRMGVDPGGLAFGLDKLSHELHPQQYLRELTQNGIEAVQKTSRGTGTVVWDVTSIPWGDGSVEKLCCIDNGVGMTPEEMIEYINTGFKSGKHQGHAANFGIGAKVAGLTFNKAGLLYISWKDGKGSMVHLIQDQETGEYGLKQLERAGGTYGYWAPVSDAIKPAEIHTHGTMVILLGDKDEANTFKAPKDAINPSAWIAYYLSARYFRLPEGVTLKARDQSWVHKDNQASIRPRRTVTGQANALANLSLGSGCTEIEGATVHWWLLPEQGESNSKAPRRGHIAALHNDELYELATLSKGGAQRLQNFGVLVGTGRVVLYVEPTPAGDNSVEPNLTRTRLLLNRGPLPWSEWAAAFAEKMPAEIAEMMDQMFAGATSHDNDRTIRRRLAKIAELLDVHRYKPNPEGLFNAEEDTEGGEPQDLGQTKEKNGKSGGLGGLSSALYKLLRSDVAPPAEKKQTKSKYPKVQWVSRAAGTRSAGDLEGRAARYLPTSNTILANEDFIGFEQMADLIGREIHAPRGFVKQLAQLEYETVLSETVMSMLSLEGSKEWSTEEVREALSESALTTAVMSRYHVYQVVRKDALRKAKAQAKEGVA